MTRPRDEYGDPINPRHILHDDEVAEMVRVERVLGRRGKVPPVSGRDPFLREDEKCEE